MGSRCFCASNDLTFNWFVSAFLQYSVLEFFNYLNTFYGTITDFCTNQNCPKMTAGPRYILAHTFSNALYWNANFLRRTEYHWIDKRSSLPAPQYIDFVFTSIQNTLLDESVFPTKAGRLSPAHPARLRERHSHTNFYLTHSRS